MCSSTVSSTSSRTGGPKRRRSSSFSSAASRFSASSSSTSRSSLRVTRKVCTPSTSMPGKSRLRCSPITSSSGTKRSLPTGTKRAKIGGTLTRAKCSLPVFGLRTSTAMFSDSPEMYGNGWAGSTASGVRTGKTRSLKSFLHCRCSSRVRSSQRTSSMFSLASAGTISSRNRVAWRSISSDDVLQICSSTSRGIRPDAARDRHPGGDPSLESGDPHHEELVEVGGEDRQEAHPLQQREAGVLGELEHPAVEVQPGDLAVQEPVRLEVVGPRVVRRLDVEGLAADGAQVGGTVPGRTADVRGQRAGRGGVCGHGVIVPPQVNAG